MSPPTGAPFPEALPAPLARAVAELGYTSMTPIQAAALPALLDGADLVAQSRTGSGKTAAFGLPLLARIDLRNRRPQALVLCPTRELGAQVVASIRALGRHLPGLRVVLLAGGQPGGPQRAALEEGVHVVVGTPGRTRDLLDRERLEVRHIHTAVLDEADRMLDMGFLPDVEHILGALPTERQTGFWSATWPHSVAELSDRWQNTPTHVVIADEEEAPSALRQVAVVVDDKEAALRALCRSQPGPAIVFRNLKATAAELAETLRADGVDAACLSGDLEQIDRDRVLALLRNGSLTVLVATDVAARGLDVDDLALVINADLPTEPTVYVHRIGRTGRAGRTGLAIAVATPRETGKLARYEAFTGAPIERCELAELADPNAVPVPAPMRTLYIGAGRRDKLRPTDVLGALTGDAGLRAEDVGRIEIHDRHTFVAIVRDLAEHAYTRLVEGKIKGRRLRVDRVRPPR